MTKKRILDVPKFKQEGVNICEPAALRMVFAYYGVHKTEKQVIKGISEINPNRYSFYPIHGYGTRTKDTVKYARTQDFSGHIYKNTSLDKLIELIDKGHPQIARIQHILAFNYAHVCVVKGYDLEKKLIYYNDPGDLRLNKMDFTLFQVVWRVYSDYDKDSINWITSIKPKK